MYKVAPKGINIKQNERTVMDGYLQESINMQWRDGSYRPIPERLASDITNTAGKLEIILHKVSDEDRINVLMFTVGGLSWYGVIEDGVYTAFGTPVMITSFPTVTDFDSFSYTILNGIIYAMSVEQQFYYSLQYSESKNSYTGKDLYAWKSLIPFFPDQSLVQLEYDVSDFTEEGLVDICGYICIRFAIVLKTGEVVMPSPIYPYMIYNITGKDKTSLEIGDALKNIHTFVNMNLSYSDMTLFENEVSAINVYASVPTYTNEYSGAVTLDSAEITAGVQKQAESPFYLIKTIEKPTTDRLLLHAGPIDSERLTYTVEASLVDLTTIAAGELMPVDNFTYHYLYGRITSSNGRLIIDKPKTALSKGHMRSLAIFSSTSGDIGYEIETEDGKLNGVSYEQAETPEYLTTVYYKYRGILSYPDNRVSSVGSNAGSGQIALFKTRANNSHNLSNAFDLDIFKPTWESVVLDGTTLEVGLSYAAFVVYTVDKAENVDTDTKTELQTYTSENRIQFSEAGEFSVWPALVSRRIGEGKIMFVGLNSVDPANTDYIAPLIVGTTDGVYTVNFDVTGSNLIQSITKAANMPALSSNNVNIDQSIIYVSDKGLMAIVNGELTNLTDDFFPEQGSDPFPTPNSVYPNYDLLVSNSYPLIDIIEYMSGAIFAYDGRRNNLWCCNPNEDYSLVYNILTKQWSSSTYVFNKVIDLFSTVTSSEGNVYSRYLVNNSFGSLDILSGENPDVMVEALMLTRPIKIQNPDAFKSIERLISRCELYVENGGDGYFTFGVWGKQDLNKNKVNIPLIAINDNSTFSDDIRQDIPIGRQKGKYKTITILQGGKMLPTSSIDGFEIKAYLVENNLLR